MKTAEEIRLEEAKSKVKPWKRWGPYLSERQWGTVREDYSADGSAWDYFPHDHARSRVYRWGEDGIAGISDHYQNLCFSVALHNGNDTVIKERLYGLSGTLGNHGEDCKELYYYLDNTPTHAYMKYLYKYPHAKFPYGELHHVNRNRSKEEPEFEITDTGIFDENRYFDVQVEYAKDGPFDILIKITAFNRGKEAHDLSVLPTLWFRNLWDFGIWKQKPSIEKINSLKGFSGVHAQHHIIGDYYLYFNEPDRLMFTENETNMERIFHTPNATPYIKDAINDAVVKNDFKIFENHNFGTKVSPMYKRNIAGEGKEVFYLKLTNRETKENPFGEEFEAIFKKEFKRLIPFMTSLFLKQQATI